MSEFRFSELCGFSDKQWLATETADAHRFTLFGGSRGPGKSYWLRWYGLRLLLELAFGHGVYNARVGLFAEDYPTLADRQISKIRIEFPLWLGELKSTQTDGLGFYLRPEYGGGILLLRNLDDPAKYAGAEFAALLIDELTRAVMDTFDTLRGSLRWPGVRAPKFCAAAMPGGVGHAWVKALWLDRQFPERLQRLAGEFAFVRALPDDNPHLPVEYWQDLETLPEDLARAWRWGDWDVFAGQAFGKFLRERHVRPPRRIPAHWPKWRAVDWGFRKPWCCLWGALDPDTGRMVVYREAYEAELTDRAQARKIKALTPAEERIRYTLADPSMWTKKNREDTTFSTADEYAAEGVRLLEADNDRLIGKRKIDTLLEDLEDGQPGLEISEACPNLARTLPALVYDKVHPEDVDSAGEDHAYDTLKYLLSRVNPRPRRTALPAPPRIDPLLKKARRARRGTLGSRDL